MQKTARLVARVTGRGHRWRRLRVWPSPGLRPRRLHLLPLPARGHDGLRPVWHLPPGPAPLVRALRARSSSMSESRRQGREETSPVHASPLLSVPSAGGVTVWSMLPRAFVFAASLLAALSSRAGSGVAVAGVDGGVAVRAGPDVVGIAIGERELRHPRDEARRLLHGHAVIGARAEGERIGVRVDGLVRRGVPPHVPYRQWTHSFPSSGCSGPFEPGCSAWRRRESNPRRAVRNSQQNRALTS